jgi:hypothetical protein
LEDETETPHIPISNGQRIRQWIAPRLVSPIGELPKPAENVSDKGSENKREALRAVIEGEAPTLAEKLHTSLWKSK